MVTAVVLLLRFLSMVIFVDVILSWVMPDPFKFPRNLTRQITEPMYAPVHAVLSPQVTGGLDFSPIIIIMLLNYLARTLASMSA